MQVWGLMMYVFGSHWSVQPHNRRKQCTNKKLCRTKIIYKIGMLHRHGINRNMFSASRSKSSLGDFMDLADRAAAHLASGAVAVGRLEGKFLALRSAPLTPRISALKVKIASSSPLRRATGWPSVLPLRLWS